MWVRRSNFRFLHFKVAFCNSRLWEPGVVTWNSTHTIRGSTLISSHRTGKASASCLYFNNWLSPPCSVDNEVQMLTKTLDARVAASEDIQMTNAHLLLHFTQNITHHHSSFSICVANAHSNSSSWSQQLVWHVSLCIHSIKQQDPWSTLRHRDTFYFIYKLQLTILLEATVCWPIKCRSKLQIHDWNKKLHVRQYHVYKLSLTGANAVSDHWHGADYLQTLWTINWKHLHTNVIYPVS